MIVSPSTRRFSRKTPCVLGCCGPMLTMNWSVSSSWISTPLGKQRQALGIAAARERLAQSLKSLGTFKFVPNGLDFLGAEMLAVALVDPAGKDLGRSFVVRLEKILAEREISEALPHQDALQLGVAREAHAHHVIDLALLEIGPTIHMIERGNLAGPFGLGGAHPQLDQLPLALGAESSW